jgi:hypothetical protein
MSIELKVNVNLGDSLAKLDEILRRVEDFTSVVEFDADEMINDIIIGAKGVAPVDTGMLRESIMAEGSFPSYTIVVDVPYAAYVEYGCLFSQHLNKILTEKGWKSWKEVKVGDKVYTHLKRWKTVLEKYHKTLYKSPPKISIHIDSGQKITCTKNHPFRIIENGEEVWKSAEEIKVGDKIICIFNDRNCKICGKELKVNQKITCSQTCRSKLFVQQRNGFLGKNNPNYGNRYKMNLTIEQHQKRSNDKKGRNNPMYKYPRHGEYFSNYGFREDLEHVCRSSWEANICRILKEIKIPYEYEPKTFILSNGQSYTPDILVHDVKDYFVEIKGFLSDNNKEKIGRFVKEYSEIPLQIISSSEYRDIEEKWKNLLNWEDKNFKIFDPDSLHQKICLVNSIKCSNNGGVTKELYDLIVEDDHSYVANNMVVHNTSKMEAQPYLWPVIYEAVRVYKGIILRDFRNAMKGV